MWTGSQVSSVADRLLAPPPLLQPPRPPMEGPLALNFMRQNERKVSKCFADAPTVACLCLLFPNGLQTVDLELSVVVVTFSSSVSFFTQISLVKECLLWPLP